MSKNKGKRKHDTGLTDFSEIALKIGKDLDNEPISLERGKYVDGCISSGSFIIDLMMGGGIVFPGKWTTAWGPEMSGKSTLTLCVIARAIRNKIPVFLFDHEAAFDPMYARNLGIRTSKKENKGKQNPYFRYFQPTAGERTYRYMARMLQEMPDHDGSKGSLPHALFVIDSLAAMVPEDLMDDDEKNSMAAMARLHADYMRRVKSLMGRKNVSVLATNQLREKPGVSFGDPRYEPGGNAVKFYPDAKLMMTAVQQPFNERGRDMRFVNLKSTKNKMFCPFRVVKEKLAIAFGRGFERGYDGLGYLQLTGQIEGGGKKYQLSMDGEKKLNGTYTWDALMELTHKNEWRKTVREQMKSGFAFRAYMDHEGLDPEADIDEEDAGTGDKRKEREKAKKLRLKEEAAASKSSRNDRAEKAKNKGKKKPAESEDEE